MAPDRNSTGKGSLAATASDQIRAIVEAAEQAAAQIRIEAEEEASRIRARAEEEATGIRTHARSDVRELIESIRSGLSRVLADLESLEERLTTQASSPAARAAEPEIRVPEAVGVAPAEVEGEETEDEVDDDEVAEPADSDLESARLVALNMALSGAEREDVDRYLSEHFALANPGALLDEVYSAVGG